MGGGRAWSRSRADHQTTLLLKQTAAAASLQSCPTLCNPIDGSPPGSPVPGIPFPSPMHESEVAQLCLTLSDPKDCSLPGSSIHGIFQARVLEWDAIASIPTLKPSTTQGPTSSRARHTTQILQQHRNITLRLNIQADQSHTKPTDISKLITGHFMALKKEEIQPHPAEHQHKLP